MTDPRRSDARPTGSDGSPPSASSPARLCVSLAVWTIGLVALSGTAGAHGGDHHGGTPVGFAVVVGMPVVAGLVGGGAALRLRGARGRFACRRRAGVLLGFLLVVLGAVVALAGVGLRPGETVAGGAVGVAAVVWTSRRTGAGRIHSDHADLAVGALGLHRTVEGVVLGALYGASAVVGLVGATAVAAHAAVETAAVGGVYAARRRRHVVVAVVLVQLCYAAGAAAGFVAVASVPDAVRVAALGLVGGVLMCAGAIETGRAVADDDSEPVPADARSGR